MRISDWSSDVCSSDLSTAGVINIVTKQPVDRFEGELEGSVTSDEEIYLRGLVNLPLTEKARLRLNAFYRDRAPLVENLAGEDIHAIQAHGVNAKLAVDLSEDATFTSSEERRVGKECGSTCRSRWS